jgi:hypothetical protein
VSPAPPIPSDVWAAGYSDPIYSGEFVAHWDGRRWIAVGPHPVLGRDLESVAVAGTRDVWVVGSQQRIHVGTTVRSAPRLLAEHYGCAG